MAKQIKIRLTTDAAKYILEKTCEDRSYGARPLRRALQKYVEDPLSEALIQGCCRGRPSSKFTWVTRAFITAPSPKLSPWARARRSPAFRSIRSERSSRQFPRNVRTLSGVPRRRSRTDYRRCQHRTTHSGSS